MLSAHVAPSSQRAARARVRFTTGDDFRIDRDPESLTVLRHATLDGEWTWLRQVHGADVVVVTEPGEHAGATADAAVTNHPDAVLAVHTADCVPVLFRGGASVVGAAHAGWRGLVGGVIHNTVTAMGDLGAESVHAIVGPHIRGRCYEFGSEDLDTVADRFGDEVRATTAWGTPALDLTAAVGAALRDGQVSSVQMQPGCTACEPDRFFSHRARGDAGRHAAAIRLGEA